MNYRNGVFSLAMIFTMLFLVALGCGGSGVKCVGTVMYEGKKFEGGGKDELEAKEGACNNYCRDADPEYEARYRIWVESPKGKAKGSPPKHKALYEDPGLLDYVVDVCGKRCVQTMNPTASCKK
jgi:hypothetical protein